VPKLIRALRILPAVAFLLRATMPLAFAAELKVLHSFCGGQSTCTDGYQPASGLIADASGNLYGTTLYGGDAGHGTVFELMPQGNGKWTEKRLYRFGFESDGRYPSGALVFDKNGNLYGTTTSGGSNDNNAGGTVFELSPSGDGTWSESIFYNFCSDACKDGKQPSGGLIFDATGNLYGVTAQGGSHSNSNVCPGGCGIVFELSPSGNGTWTESVLYNFCSTGQCADGAIPNSSLAFDASGDRLYGVTGAGGTAESDCKYGCGTVFELTPGTNGTWSEKALHRFNYTTGAFPFCSPIFDSSGNLYCTANEGGEYGLGVTYQLQPSASGQWEYKVIHNFGKAEDGQYPQSGLVAAPQGDLLYGTTSSGGSHVAYGTIFELTFTGGEWIEKILFNFDSTDGAEPSLPLFQPNGSLYGTTRAGGNSPCSAGCGTAFELAP
jgi:uncharacterized repeat protein (TIGR03803 family)